MQLSHGIHITNARSSTLFAMKLRQRESTRFITLIGGNTYSLLRGLTRPKIPAEVSYGDLVTTLQKHLCPKPLVIAERFCLNRREQDGENILDYVAALRKLYERCLFDEVILDEMLPDRLVCGLHNEHIQTTLLSEADLTCTSALDIAVAMEIAA